MLANILRMVTLWLIYIHGASNELQRYAKYPFIFQENAKKNIQMETNRNGSTEKKRKKEQTNLERTCYLNQQVSVCRRRLIQRYYRRFEGKKKQKSKRSQFGRMSGESLFHFLVRRK